MRGKRIILKLVREKKGKMGPLTKSCVRYNYTVLIIANTFSQTRSQEKLIGGVKTPKCDLFAHKLSNL